MFAKGLSETIKVLKICYKLFDLLMSRNILDILNALTTVVELPIEKVESLSRTIVPSETEIISRSNRFHLSKKY